MERRGKNVQKAVEMESGLNGRSNKHKNEQCEVRRYNL